MTLFDKKYLTTVVLYGIATFSYQSAWAEGIFTATKSCETYLSTKKLNNPDGFKLKVGQSYQFVKGNKPDTPKWYLLHLNAVASNTAERWVEASCGNVDNNSSNEKTSVVGNNAKTDKSSCSLANQSDSYVFAVSWQPAFCESKPEKKECQISDAGVYQASHFTLHGLWPNKSSCGINYGYCGDVKSKPKDFCQYPSVALSAEVKELLAVVMPSVSAGSCLERHEWHKHGTCQLGSPDEYCNTAIKLVHQFNDNGISQFMKEHIGKTVAVSEFRAILDSNLGQGASNHAKLGCKDGLLVDIYLNLPAQIKPDDNLKELLSKAPPAETDKSCEPGFRIDEIGQF